MTAKSRVSIFSILAAVQKIDELGVRFWGKTTSHPKARVRMHLHNCNSGSIFIGHDHEIIVSIKNGMFYVTSWTGNEFVAGSVAEAESMLYEQISEKATLKSRSILASKKIKDAVRARALEVEGSPYECGRLAYIEGFSLADNPFTGHEKECASDWTLGYKAGYDANEGRIFSLILN